MSEDSDLNRVIYEMGNGYVSTILVPVNYVMLTPDLQFMLGVCHGHSPWLSSTSTPQIGKAKYLSYCHNCKCDFSKKPPWLMLIFFLQTFTGQRQVTPWTARSKACSLQCRLQVGQIICVASSPYYRHHLMHSWRSSIKRASILTKDICGTLRDLVPFAQFKKREQRPWRSVNFSKIVG